MVLGTAGTIAVSLIGLAFVIGPVSVQRAGLRLEWDVCGTNASRPSLQDATAFILLSILALLVLAVVGAWVWARCALPRPRKVGLRQAAGGGRRPCGRRSAVSSPPGVWCGLLHTGPCFPRRPLLQPGLGRCLWRQASQHEPPRWVHACTCRAWSPSSTPLPTAAAAASACSGAASSLHAGCTLAAATC